MMNINIYLSAHELAVLSQGDRIKRSILHKEIPNNEVFVVIYNKELDSLTRSHYMKILNRNFSVVPIALSPLDIDKLSGNKTLVIKKDSELNIHLSTVHSCPLCYTSLIERSDALFECPSCHITVCRHVLNQKNSGNTITFIFTCSNCSELSIEKCSCTDCQVYCSVCKKFLLIACENLQKTLTKQQNEEHKDA